MKRRIAGIERGEFTGRGVLEYEFIRSARPRGTLVMIHGAGSKMVVWDRQLPLAESYNLLRFSGSTHDKETGGDVLSLCRKLGIAHPHVIAHSMGSESSIGYCRAAAGDALYAPQTLTHITPTRVVLDGDMPLPHGILAVFSAGEVLSPEMLRNVIMYRRRDAAEHLLRVAVMPSPGHFPFRDQPGMFNEMLMGFLENQ